MQSVRLGLTLCLFAISLLQGQQETPTLGFQISTETVPLGATAQIKLFLTMPQPIRGGHAVFRFNGGDYPQAPPRIVESKVFSASGDVSAIASVDTSGPPAFSIYFTSPSAGVGRVRGLPVAVFSIPVTAAFTVNLDVAASTFGGPGGVRYQVTAAPGGASIGGALSIQKVTVSNLSAVVPEGTLMRLDGTGFTSGTQVAIEGVLTGGVEFVSPNAVHVGLLAPAQLIGKRLRLSNAGTAPVEYWIGPDASGYTLPFAKSANATCRDPGPGLSDPITLVQQNPNNEEAEVTITNAFVNGSQVPSTVVRIGGGATAVTAIRDPANSNFSSALPLRSICFARTRSPNFTLLTWLPIDYSTPPEPAVGWIGNAASQERTNLAPGEIVAIFGTMPGPAIPLTFTLDASNKVPTVLGGVRLLINGVPSPILYASSSQVNAVIPYETPVQGAVMVRLERATIGAPTEGAPSAPSSPGVFTLNSTGIGEAAVLNQDNTVNGPANAAAAGSIIQIFGTGEGLTTPDGVTGGVAGTPPNLPRLPVSVSIGGMDAPVVWAGKSPGSINGLFQVNATVPANAPVGAAVPIRVAVGSASSSPGPTIAVK
jgi:uncharacterized protein (TIGR03437 family)